MATFAHARRFTAWKVDILSIDSFIASENISVPLFSFIGPTSGRPYDDHCFSELEMRLVPTDGTGAKVD